MEKGLSRITFSKCSHRSNDLGFSNFNFCNWENKPWFSSSATLKGNQQLIMFVPKPAHAALCYWSLLCNDIWPQAGGGSTRGHQCNGNYQLSSELWPMKSDSYKQRVYQMDLSLLKCALYVFYFYWLSIDLCRLLTLGMFWGEQERGGRLSPYYWNSVLLRPDESFRICFCFICIFPELEELKGECSATLKDKKSWGLWQREK